MLRHLFSDPYVCTIVITHAMYSINIAYTQQKKETKKKKIIVVSRLNFRESYQ